MAINKIMVLGAGTMGMGIAQQYMHLLPSGHLTPGKDQSHHLSEAFLLQL